MGINVVSRGALGALGLYLGLSLLPLLASAQTCGPEGRGVCTEILECASGNYESDNACGSGTVCCYSGSSGGGNTCTGTCRTITSGCIAPEQPGTGTCSSNQMCCDMPASGGQNECQLGGGTCRTVSNGCIAPETPSVRSCTSSNQMCCDMPGGSGGSGSTGNTGVTGSTCANKVGGVCFPTGTGLSEKSVVEIITNFISWILGIFGFVAILGFIVSGLQYLFATGDEGMAETAKRNMKYAVIGVIVALSGWIVIQAVDAFLSASAWI